VGGGGLLCCVFAFTLRTCDCCFSPTERTKTDWAAEIKRRRSHFEKLPAAIRFRFRPVRSWAFKRSCELISEASGAFANRSAEARWSEWRDVCQREMERKSGRAGGDTLASGSSRVDREVFKPNTRTTYNPYLPWKRSGKKSTFYFKQITTLSSNLHKLSSIDRDFLRIYVQEDLGGQTWFSCNWISEFPVLL